MIALHPTAQDFSRQAIAGAQRRCLAREVVIVLCSPSDNSLSAGPADTEEWLGRAYCGFRAEDYRLRGVPVARNDFAAIDRASWRILAIAGGRRIAGALTFRRYLGSFDLITSYVAKILAGSGRVDRQDLIDAYLRLVVSELDAGRTVFEASHWCVAMEFRKSPVAVALMSKLGQIASATACWTVLGLANCRTGAASIVERIGGSEYSEVPAFYHPWFRGELRLLGARGGSPVTRPPPDPCSRSV